MVKYIWKSILDVVGVFCDGTVVVTGFILSFIFSVTGQQDKMIECLLIFMTLDYFTGIIKSIIKKELSSKIGFCGFLKKILILSVVVMAYRLDTVLQLTNSYYNCRFVAISFYLANEGLSILENCVMAGLKVPTQLKEILKQCQDTKIKK